MTDFKLISITRCIDIKPHVSGGLLNVALSAIELLEENDMSTMELVNMIQSNECSRQELLDQIIYELEQVSMSGVMEAPLADINGI